MPDTFRYSVRVSASDDCDCRRTYEALWELGEVPDSRDAANNAAQRLTALLAADGYTDRIVTRIDGYTAVTV